MALSHSDSAVVTGAFSYSGRYVARRLLDEGVSVRTLTRSPERRDPFGGLVPAAPLDFSDPDGLCRTMEGAGVLYNTYWIRFGRGRATQLNLSYGVHITLDTSPGVLGRWLWPGDVGEWWVRIVRRNAPEYRLGAVPFELLASHDPGEMQHQVIRAHYFSRRAV